MRPLEPGRSSQTRRPASLQHDRPHVADLLPLNEPQHVDPGCDPRAVAEMNHVLAGTQGADVAGKNSAPGHIQHLETRGLGAHEGEVNREIP